MDLSKISELLALETSTISILAIILAGLLLIAIIALLLRNRAVKFKLGKNEISFAPAPVGRPGSKTDIPEFGWRRSALLSAFNSMLSQIYDDIKLMILTHMKRKLKVSQEHLPYNNDYHLIMALVHSATYGQNGKHSIRTIIEDRIMRREFQVHDIKDRTANNRARQLVMQAVIPQIQSEVADKFDKNYTNTAEIYQKDKDKHLSYERLILQGDIINLLREHIHNNLSPVIETLFDIEENLRPPKGEK